MLLHACGGAERAVPRPQPEAPAEPSWSERAQSAFDGGELERARFAAQNALQLDATDERAREIAARIALAEHRLDDAIGALESATSPGLVRLRARVHLTRGDYGAAATDLASVEHAEPRDPWSDALLPLARAASSAELFRVEGPERVQLPLVDAPLPVVAVSIDGRPAQALIATSVDVVLVSEVIHDGAIVLPSIGFDGLTVHGVPALSKDLTPIGGQLHAQIDLVIGLDLLLRLRATLHGRERWLSLRTSGTDATEESRSVPFVTFGGGVLAVHAELGEEVAGYFSFDTAGLFPIALSEGAVRALALTEEQLEEIPGAPNADVRMTQIAEVRAGDIALEQVPAVTGLIPADNNERLGAPLLGSFGAQLAMAMKTTFDAEERVLRLE